MKATDTIKEVFENYETNVLNVSGLGLDDGYYEITHVVLDGNNLRLYSGNPELGNDFQDDYYEQLDIEDSEEEKWDEIKHAIISL